MNERDFDEYLVRVYRVRKAGREEYREFLRDLYFRQLEPKLSRPAVRAALDRWGERREQLYASLRDMGEVAHQLDRLDPGELPGGIRQQTDVVLREAAQRVVGAVRTSNELLVANDIAEVIEEHFGLIVDGLDAAEVPGEDVDALAEAGSSDPRGDLAALVYRVKSQKEDLLRRAAETSFKRQFEHIEERLQHIEQLIREQSVRGPRQVVAVADEKRRKRRWFKILGQAGTGSAVFLVDCALGHAVGLADPVTAAGVVQSATTGVGSMLMGVGDLFNE